MCLRCAVELRNSHLIPKGVYRRLLSKAGTKTLSPLKVMSGIAVQTSDQVTQHLLCHGCEQRLSKNGESWVLANGLQQDGTTFPFYTNLRTLIPTETVPQKGFLIYRPGVQPWFDPHALAYFACSVIWRAGVAKWGGIYDYPLPLGPYAEDLRRYLMSEIGFPATARLFVTVRTGGPHARTMRLPGSDKDANGAWFHIFLIPGFSFRLHLSRQISEALDETCMMHNANYPLVVADVRFDKAALMGASRLRAGLDGNPKKDIPFRNI